MANKRPPLFSRSNGARSAGDQYHEVATEQRQINDGQGHRALRADRGCVSYLPLATHSEELCRVVPMSMRSMGPIRTLITL